jgi:FHA domain
MSKLNLKFRIFKNNELVGFRELNQAVIKIGKVGTAHLALEDESVSRMHAIIEVSDVAAHIIDLGSTRGTFVNGQKVNKAKLTDGDEIRIGDLRLELAISEAAVPTVVVEAPKAPPPLPVAPRPAPTAVLPAPAIAFADAMRTTCGAVVRNDEPGARAVEVAAMFGDSVVDVKHCMDPRGGKVTPMTWGFLAGGLASLLMSATAFYVSVDTAAANKASLNYHVNVLKKPAYSHRPKQIGTGVDYAAFGGLALGLMAMTAGLARARGEKKSPYYRIGTAPGVEQPIEGAPAADFPMVAPSGDDFVFNYGAGMEGEMTVDGKSTPLANLVSAGLARPSASTAGAIEVPIPANAKIRARAGQTTFLVSAVNKPAKQAAPLFNIERRTAAYVAGSLAVHLGIIAFLQTIPPDDSGVNVTFDSADVTGMRTSMAEKDTVPPEPEEKDEGSAGQESAGGQMAFESGMAGKPDAPNADGHMRIKDRGETKQLSREQAVEQAMNAGIMGSVQQIRGGIAAVNGTADFESGFDTSSVYGPLIGGEGEGRGTWGMGVTGWSTGGGCLGGDCGLVGTGRYGTIGNGDRAGDGWGGRRGKGGWRGREAAVPKVDISRPEPSDGLDRAIIKRYVKRQLAQISYCYESELLVKPNLEGTVTVQFLITSSGTVSQSTGGGMDAKVANCVSGVVKNIAFPKPTNGGNVQVNYPFTFRAAGR